MNKYYFSIFALLISSLIIFSCETLEYEEPGVLVPRTVDEDTSLPSITVNGTQLHSETFGNPENPMIVVIHGGPGSDYRSLLNCKQFSSDGFYVVFYDQRGSGLSKRHNKGIYTTQLSIDDLDAVIKYYRRPQQKVILMGLSWGAMLATAYVNENPNQINGLVLMEPGGFKWSDTEAFIKRWRNSDLFDESINDYFYIDQLMTNDNHNALDYKAALQSTADFAKGNKLGNPGPAPFWRMGAVCSLSALEYVREHPFDFTQNLSQYTNKVLFLYSELDVAYGKTHAELVSSAYPNVQLVEIKGVGHEIPYFGWNRFYSVAKTYLDTIK